MIDVGKIVAAHGIKGEVKVLSLSSNPKRFQKGSEMYLGKTGETLKILSVRPQKDLLIVAFDTVFDRNKAEALKGALLQINDDEVAPLPDGEFYFFQMEGAEITDEEGKALGILSDILEGGAGDVYRITLENGDYLLLPALKQVVKKIDIENKRMMISLLPGLLEACRYHEN